MNPPDASPFRDPANRMVRPVEAVFEQAFSAQEALVRLVGPRRVGKTRLVHAYCAKHSVPLVDLTIPALAPDLDPAAEFLPLLREGVGSLAHSSPELFKEYNRLLKKESPRDWTEKLGGKIAGNLPGFFGLELTGFKEENAQLQGSSDKVQIGAILNRLERAAKSCGLRPICLFDEVQELVGSQTKEPDLSAAWAIRNAVQNHHCCRHVFAGSNQRMFALLETGSKAPFLNMGTAIEVPAVTAAEIDTWAKPLFGKGRRHVGSLALISTLAAGKIGEAVDVFNELWLATKPGDVISEEAQRTALLKVVNGMPRPEFSMKSLTVPQARVLRWVLERPGQSPYGPEADRLLQMNPGTINGALKGLLEAQLIENFGGVYCATLPLRTMRAMQPQRLREKLLAVAVPIAPAKAVLKLKQPGQHPRQSL